MAGARRSARFANRVALSPAPALALKPIPIPPIPIASRSRRSARPTTAAATRCRSRPPPALDGVGGRMSVRATTPGTNPNWFVFALTNTTDKPMERWLTADRYNVIGSGVVWPDLDARRIDAVTPSVGYVPERIKNDRADVFRLTLEPGQTVTFVAELASDRFARLFLWKPHRVRAEEPRPPALQRHHAGHHRPARHLPDRGVRRQPQGDLPGGRHLHAGACWPTCAWTSASGTSCSTLRPEENAQYRAAAEAAHGARACVIFLYTFLRLGAWHGFVRMLHRAVDGGAACRWSPWRSSIRALPPPSRACQFHRHRRRRRHLTLFLAIARPGPRAVAGADLDAAPGVDVRRRRHASRGGCRATSSSSASSAGLVLIVVLIGFTVTQYAFRSLEPLYGAQPGEQQLRSLAVDGAGAAVWEWNARRDEIKVSPVVEAIARPRGRRAVGQDRRLRQAHAPGRPRALQAAAVVDEGARRRQDAHRVPHASRRTTPTAGSSSRPPSVPDRRPPQPCAASA